MKECGTCGVTKPLEDFYRSQRNKDGRQYHCKLCGNRKRREWAKANPEQQAKWAKQWHATLTPEQKINKKLRCQFRMTLEEFEDRASRQGGVCAACGTPPPAGQRLHVDHDHACCPGRFTCGKCVRGLLCLNCNAALGHAKDDKDRLMQLINYLDGG